MEAICTLAERQANDVNVQCRDLYINNEKDNGKRNETRQKTIPGT